jgi:hypothetical protein
MKLKNETNIPNKTVKAIIDAVSPVPLEEVKSITLINYRRDGGFLESLYHGNGRYDYKNKSIVIRLPVRNPGKEFRTRMEALVFLLAHELKHAEQHKRGKLKAVIREDVRNSRNLDKIFDKAENKNERIRAVKEVEKMLAVLEKIKTGIRKYRSIGGWRPEEKDADAYARRMVGLFRKGRIPVP